MKKLFLMLSVFLVLFLLIGRFSQNVGVDSAIAEDVPAPSRYLFLPIVIQGGQPSDDGLWQPVNESSLIEYASQRRIIPDRYHTLTLDDRGLAEILAQAPLEFSVTAADNPVQMSLPLPDGRYLHVKLFESPIMAPELASRYPQIKTYIGQGIEDPSVSARIDWTPKGFHAQIFFAGQTYYVDPYSTADTTHYISYDQRFLKSSEPFIEPDASNFTESSLSGQSVESVAAVASGDQLRTYRLALAATGEYTAFHGGTVADALAAMVTTMNRVNGIYEQEVAIRMTLVANTDDVIYTDGSTDPYINGNTTNMVAKNQITLDMEIGNGNYDIGHVFGTGTGGFGPGRTCNNSTKAQGATARPSPQGDAFDVDYVAHEMGHQFSASHTWTGTQGSCSAGQFTTSSAYEPGSGSTIMGYAGICGSDNLQGGPSVASSDAYFHTRSFDQIIAYVTSGTGNTCGTTAATGNNEPTANANGNFTIPVNTPFILTGSGSDPDGDALTYNWEEYDLGPQGSPTDSTNPPYFRSWPATTDPSRTFPRLSDLVNNTTVIGEVLPTVGDVLNFRLTVRDNRAGGGGVDHDQMQVTVSAAAGPFRVTAPNTAVSWQVTGSETVNWNVANSDQAPVNCANVDLLLSLDGGFTYPVTLASGVTNDGTQAITVPDNPDTQARVKVACANNIFFDISNQNFTIIPLADAGGPYTTDEGVNVALDGSNSSSADLYEWDLDNNGTYEVTGVAPEFDLVGQDGVYTVRLRVTRNGVSATDTATVTVNNVAPTVTLGSDAPVDENSAVTVDGVISDPGWLEALTGTIDWGDGTPVEAISGTLENVRPDATLIFTADHVYGDNGIFTAEVCGFDDDTAVCETINLQIDNVDPTAEIDMSGAIDINGTPTFLTEAGAPIDFSGHITDPGSDDITVYWDWGDGSPVEATSYLVNPTNPDPFPSPTIQPRDIMDNKSHTFADACMYEIQLWAEDDDGGVSTVDTATVMIVGTAMKARHAGYWQHQYSGSGEISFDEATLLCYLQIVDHVSTVFNEERSAATIAEAYDVLWLAQNGGSTSEKFDRRLLTVWLNVANGGLDYLGLHDYDNDKVDDGTLKDIVATAETARLNPATTDSELKEWTRILTLLINH